MRLCSELLLMLQRSRYECNNGEAPCNWLADNVECCGEHCSKGGKEGEVNKRKLCLEEPALVLYHGE